MIVVVFINKQDRGIEIVGKSLVSLLNKKFYIFSREPSQDLPTCTVEMTMPKLREICAHTPAERIVVSFGCRVFPTNMKEIESIAKTTTGNIVLLKRLRGSKTWTYKDSKLSFDNERIADCGIFMIDKASLLTSTELNFNTFIRNLLASGNMTGKFVEFWVFSNEYKTKENK